MLLKGIVHIKEDWKQVAQQFISNMQVGVAMWWVDIILLQLSLRESATEWLPGDKVFDTSQKNYPSAQET